jgi:hypothetical protein
MKLHHPHISGRTIEITPLSARDLARFPRHSCSLSERQNGRAIYTRLETSQSTAILYCKQRNYLIPFGF